MAQTTVELGQLLERTNFELFDFDYKFDDPIFKKEIEQAITDFYYFYEIGQETPDRFKHSFKKRFLRSIDYYNKLYNTTLLSYNPLINSKMTEALEQLATASNTTKSDGLTTVTGTDIVDQDSTTTSTDVIDQDGKTTATMHSEGSATLDRLATKNQDDTGTVGIVADKNTKGSDYPQQPIAGGDFLSNENDEVSSQTTTNDLNKTSTEDEDSTTTSIDDSNSTTTVTNDTTTTHNGTATNDTTTTRNSTTTNDDTVTVNGTVGTDYTKTIEGLTGTSYQELIRKERENILRIPSMIIEELKPCFMLTY